MRLSIGRKIGLGFSAALVALVLIGFVTTLDLRELTSDAGLVTHTVEVQQRLESLKAGLPEAESSARGNQLSPNPAFKTSFRDAMSKSSSALRDLRNLTQDNPIQQQRLDQLEPLLAGRFDQLQQLLNLPVDSPNALRTQLVQEGSENTVAINRIISDMEDEETSLLSSRRAVANSMSQWTSGAIIFGTLAAFGMVALIGFFVTRSITDPLRALGDGAALIGGGNYAHRVKIDTRDEVGQMASLFNRMAEQVQQRQDSLAEQDSLKQNLSRFAPLFQGQRDFTVLCQGVLAELASILDARNSVFYLVDRGEGDPLLKLQASYASDNPRESLKVGEGLAGEVVRDGKRIVLSNVPNGYLKINSALGTANPAEIVVQPVLFEEEIKAVLELALFKPLTPIQLTFLDQLSHNLGIVLNTIASVVTTEELLRQARISEQLLQQQQEELQQTNEEMEQTNEELQQTNEEMEEKVNLLAEQKRQMEKANREIERAREELERRAQQIAEGSRYKSEFLANMSHELRTPLNSLLILSKLLADNPDANLNPKQVQYAKTIYSSGNDLLELINEVLDLAKIESGAVRFEPQDMGFADLSDFIELNFRHVAEGRHLGFTPYFSPGLPPTMKTDPRRLQQILKNLLSNAFKFTEQGSVSLTVAPVAGAKMKSPSLRSQDHVIAFTVKDTGVGIPADKHELVFGAFQQADSGTARKYGGTGLGLSISRELATLLGGELELTESSPGGSTFTLYLPAAVDGPTPTPMRPSVRGTSPAEVVQKPNASATTEPVATDPADLEDDRNNLQAGDMILLIIEDDRNFSGLMRDFAREKNFKVVTARNGAQGIAMAHRVRPSAITLDLHLPDADGWIVLDKLKHDPATRHVPIHIISVDQERERSLRLGAVSYIQKPATKETLDAALNQTIDFLNRPLKNLLIIEDDSVQRQGLSDLIGNGDVHTTAVGSAQEALDALVDTHFDCIVLDLGLPDTNGADLIRTIHQRLGVAVPPIIVYTGKELTRAEETELRLISDSIVIKNVRSPERLLDETALFLHRVQTKLPEPKQRMIEQVQKADNLLLGRKVLIVDDDVRNIFAITSALEGMKMEVFYAESGQAGIDLLAKNPDIEVILMDVMMPEMDGFEAIRRIRRMDRFKKLPIISVTAKAMKDDREKCLQAGASDYITKPVDMDQLRSLLRVWLYR
jgi:signal transduction histidine kinase/DNA-binding response OmpR family regulator/CHASE3 domain sensor protein